MNEGKQVRIAMDGPDIEHDALIAFASARNTEDRSRAESAGESRQKIGAFLEETGMNGKALSWCRQILKVRDKADSGQAKAMDIIMSLERALPMIRAEIAGQQSAMNLEPPAPEPVEFVDPSPSYSADPDFEELLVNSTVGG
jgi:hypothetical protein